MLNLFNAALAWLQHHRRAAMIGAVLASSVCLLLGLTYLQPRHHSTTQVARFLNDDAFVAAQFTARGLRAGETVLTRSGQDVSYAASHADAWGSAALKGSVSVMPSSGGAQIIWTLEHDAGWNPLRRWLGAALMRDQGAALQTRLQAFKQSLNVVNAVNAVNAVNVLPLAPPAATPKAAP
jgi:hypothetical protein